MATVTFTISDIANEVLIACSDAEAELRETQETIFNRNVLKLILQEIDMAKQYARHEKNICPGTHSYVYRNLFPLAVYKELPEELINQLDLLNVRIYSERNMRAFIEIVLHF